MAEYIGDMIRKRYVAEHLNKDNGRILDVGAGLGIYKPLVESKGYEYIGVDLKSTPPIIMKGDATNLSFKDEEFDSILCIDVLEHINNDQKAVNEMYRVLKKDGEAIIHSPNSEQTHILAQFEEQGDHVRKGYTKAELYRLFQEFKVVGIWPTFNILEAITWEFINLNMRIDINKLLNFSPDNYQNLGWILKAKKT